RRGYRTGCSESVENPLPLPIPAIAGIFTFRAGQGGWTEMSRIASVSFLVGDRVEVATNFTRAWVGGFEIASTSTAGCHVRRMSDGEVLPAVFSYDDLRPARPRSDLDADDAGMPAAL